MLYSIHSIDSTMTNMEIELVDNEFDISVIKEAPHPVVLSINGLTIKWRKAEADKLYNLLGYVLQELGNAG